MRITHSFIIGIDPGVKTGLCVWSTKAKRIEQLLTLSIHQAMDVVKTWKEFPGDIFVRVEDARLRTWIPRQKNEKAERDRREGAGSVKRDSKIWEDFLTDMSIPFEMVAPKNNKTKVDEAYFKKLTGWTKQTSEHARDSAFLVIGL